MTIKENKRKAAEELRRQAEAELQAAVAKGPLARTEADAQRLIHELQVHQIELQMQNEELRRSQAEVEAGLERYSELYDFAPVGYMTLDRDGAILQVNLTGARLLGVERARLPGRPLRVFVGESDRAVFHAFLEKVFKSQGKEECEVVLLNEGQRPINVNIMATVSQEGQECRVVMVDITEGKRTEKALWALSSRQEALLMAVPEIIMEVDCNKVYTWANRAGFEFFGEDVIGKEASFYFEGMQETYGAVQPLSNGDDQVFYVESWQRRRDGQKRLLAWWCRVLKDARGTITGALSSARDITEQRQAEKALRESNHVIEGILNAIPVRVFWKDKNLVYLGCNTIFARDAGFSDPKDLIGKNDYQAGWRDQAELYRSDDRQVIESGYSKFLIEEPQTTSEGNTITLLTSKIPLRNSKGEISGVLGTYMDITERKRMEGEIQRSESRLRRLAEILQHRSETIQDFLDYALKQAIQLTGSKIGYIYHYHEDRREFVLNTWSKEVMAECSIEKPLTCYELDKTGIWGEAVRQRKAIIINDFQAVHPLKKGYPKGHVELLKFMTVPIFKGESIVGVVGMANKETDYDETDILQCSLLMEAVWKDTERKRAEEALRQSEEKFRLAFRTSPDSININRLSDAVFIDINDGFTKIMGYSREDAIGKTSLELNIWVDPKDRERLLAGLKKDGFVENLEAEFRGKNGRVRIGLMSALVLLLNHEEVILSITRDITERKQAEEELRDSEERHRKIVEASSDAIILRNYGGIVIYANPAALKLFRANHPTDLIGKQYLDLVHPDDRAISAERVKKTLEESWTTSAREHRVLALDGQVVHVESIGGLVKHRGETQQFGVFRDITERKLTEQEKQKTETQLRQAQKMEAIGSLAGGIAHDFNNILSVIIGNTELLEMNDVSSNVKDGLHQVFAASQRAKQLVRQILSFSRQGEQQKLLMSLKPIVKETIDFLRASIPSTIKLQHYIKPDAGAVVADSTQMQQVLMNLCTNAAHAMENEGGVLKIVLDTKTIAEEDVRLDPGVERGEYVRLSVSDTGHGIEPGVLHRIFDPYFTTKGPDKGTGLGLAVVHGIVKSHGGIIRVYSEVGKGTVFHVLLPRADEVPKKEEKAVRLLPSGTERILVVDDEKPLADIYEKMLGMLGYQVEIRTSPVEALEAVRMNPQKYDLVITDMTMPQMTGYSLSKKLMEIRPGLPVILCTGFSDLVNEEKARSVGILAFLLKPVPLHDLANTMRKVLDESHRENHS